MNASNLGDFCKLPTELRIDLCRYLRPCTGRGILRACRQLNHEATSFLYENEIIHFRVKPIWNGWLIIGNSSGSIWRIAHAHDPMLERFANLPYQRLHKLIISIDARRQTSPAQKTLALKHVYDLVDLLRRTSGLPAIRVHLINGHHRDGTSAQRWNERDGNIRTFIIGTLDYDFEDVLMPFCQLRNVPQVSVHPSTMDDDPSIFPIVKQAMRRSEPFGTVSHGYFNDDNICMSMKRIYEKLEHQIDQSQGEEFNMLRLFRFMSWYDEDGNPKYINNWRRLLWDRDWCSLRKLRIQRRHDLLLTYNPLSKNMQKMRCQLGLPLNLKTHEFSLRNRFDMTQALQYLEKVKDFQDSDLAEDDVQAAAELKSYWNVNEWLQYYPDGLPPIDNKHTNYTTKRLMWFMNNMEGEEPREEEFRLHHEPTYDGSEDGYETDTSYTSDASDESESDDDVEIRLKDTMEDKHKGLSRTKRQLGLINFNAKEEARAALGTIRKSPQ